jgi:hypothetical protein
MKMPSRIRNCQVIITHLFDRYGHNRRTFFKKNDLRLMICGEKRIQLVY